MSASPSSADILARLAGAAPAGEGVDGRIAGLDFAADIADHWHQRFLLLHSEADKQSVLTAFRMKALGAKQVLDDIHAERARLAATPSPARSDRPAPEAFEHFGEVTAEAVAQVQARSDRAEAEGRGMVPLVAETAWGSFDPEDGLFRTVPEAVMTEFEREARNHANLWTSGNEAARQSFQVAVAKAWIGGVQSAGCVLAAAPTPPAGEGVDDEAESAFSNGVTHAIEILARAVGCLDWQIRDGSDDRDDDIAATIMGVLVGGELYNDDTGEWAHLTTPATGTDEALRVAARAVLVMAVKQWTLGGSQYVVPEQDLQALRTALGASGGEGDHA